MSITRSITTEIHPLLTKEVVIILKNKSISTIYQFLEQDALVLSKITKLTFKSILIIRKHILNKNAALKRNALEYYNEILQKTAIISTNHSNLDTILGGGFYTGNIYEVCTRNSQNYTAFIYKFMVDFLEKHKAKQKQSIMYYDTKFTFNTLYLQYICEKQFGPGKDEEILYNLLVGQVKDIHELLIGLEELKKQLKCRQVQVRLVIVDSLSAILYSTIRIEKHNMLLNKLINIMRFIAVEYHVCFIITNLLTVKQPSNCKGPCKVYGGKYWQTLPNIRLSLLEISQDNYEVCILKSNLGSVNDKCTIMI